MKSQNGKQTIVMHTLLNILRSKDNQTIKFGKLVEYNMRNMFPDKSQTKFGGETITRPFYKKLSIFFDQQCKVL